jgi:hypothetical protein
VGVRREERRIDMYEKEIEYGGRRAELITNARE